MAVAPKFEAVIDADISKFMKKAATINKTIKDMASGVVVDIGADISGFMRRAATVQATVANIENSNPTVNVNANTAGFIAQAAVVQATSATIASATPTVTVDADTAAATAQITTFMARMRAMTARNLIVKLKASWQNYQAVMGAMASFSRNFSEIVGMVGGGIKIMMSPAIVPVLASVVGLLGTLGPMIGTLGGSMFALVTSFGAAGIGAAGFAAVAIPSIGKVIETSTELKDLEDKIAKADTWKERNKLMKEQAGILKDMSKEQKAAGNALTAFKDNYSALVKDMEKPVLDVFASGLTAITGILDLARPMIENVTDAVKNLMDGLNANLKAEDTKAFFRFLERFAAPALETVGKAVGNFVMGLFNMMEAFGPLATETQNSFLNMSESFRDWSAGLSENKGFQKFSAYVSENMPKIRSIFSDAINGVITMFAAFGDSSSNMMTNLAEMMEGFLEWSRALGESQGFKSFIDYITTNGPVLLSAIGNIVDLIIELGIAAAPMGEKMLGMIDAMADFGAKMLEAHPWLGKIAIGAVVMAGAFLAALPILVGLNALLGGLIAKMIIYVARMIWTATVTVAKWVLMGVTATINAAKVVAGWVLMGLKAVWSAAKAVASAVIIVAQWVLMGIQAGLNAIKVAAAWTLSTGIAMITAVAKTTASVVLILAQWLLMGVQAGLHALKVAAAWALSTGIAMVTAVASTTASVVLILAQWVLMGAQALIHAAKVAAAWLLTTGAAMATAVAGMIATSAVFVAKWVWMGAQALIQGARMAAGWLLAMGPVGWVIAAVVGLAAIIILNWDKISDWTSKTWSKVSEWISTKWSEIKNKTTEAASNIWNTVKEKFTSIVNSVKEKMSSAKEAISNKWEEIKSAAAAKLATLVTTVGTFFTNLVTKVREKMGDAVRTVGEKVGEMPGKVLSFVGEMLSAGGDLVRGLIDGIKNMSSAAIDAISGVVGGVISKAKSLLNINSPSRVFSEFGGFISEGLANGVQNKAKLAVDQVARMANSMTGAFNPQLELANMNASANLDTSVSRADMGVVRKSFAAEIDSGEDTQPAIYVTNELVGDKILTVVNRGQAKQSRLTDGFYGK